MTGPPANIPDRLAAALSDRYRIERELGAGGMATVYLAEDLKHERRVAIKVFRPELAAVLGADRFIQEIKTTAALSHPHILPLFDSGEVGGFLYYVMPWIEGETIRDRLDRETQLGVQEAVRIATEVADALDHAHRHGVVHRDVKPENVLLHDGRAMVMDFGIALAVSAAAGGRMTETGLSLGTPHYMSPEQATADKEITARSDVYSLASVLYEMLAGEPPHMGNSAQQVIMKIVVEPVADVTTLRKSVPPNVAAALAKALEKLPADRFETARAFADALNDPHFRGPQGAATPAVGSYGESMRAPGVVSLAVVVLMATALAAWGWLRPAPAPPTTWEAIELGAVPGGPEYSFAVAPDGSAVVYMDTVRGGSLWIKEQDELDGRWLADWTGRAFDPYPSFSPDGRAVLFTDGQLVRVPRSGGAPTVLARDAQGGAAWMDDGTIVFSDGADLLRTTAAGSDPEVVVSARDLGGLPTRPVPVPGDDAVVVSVGSDVNLRLVTVDLRTGSVHALVEGAAGAWFLDGDLLVYGLNEGTLSVARFDKAERALVGAAVPVATGVQTANLGVVAAVGRLGHLLYVEGRGLDESGTGVRLAAVGRDGTETLLDTAFTFVQTAVSGVSLSPDGTRAVVEGMERGRRADLWMVQLPDGPETRLTFEGTYNVRPSWSSDGEEILYASNAGGAMELWKRRADGSGRPEKVVSESRPIVAGHWSPDGEWIVYRTDNGAAGGGDILAVRTSGDTTKLSVAATADLEYGPAFSPDGRCLAYAEVRDAPPRVVVVPFPDVDGGRWEVPVDVGDMPVWSNDGQELFFRSRGGELMAVDVDGSAPLRWGTPRTLFIDSLSPTRFGGRSYAVYPDDQRFLMLRPVESVEDGPATGGRMVLVRNWLPELRARLEGVASPSR